MVANNPRNFFDSSEDMEELLDNKRKLKKWYLKSLVENIKRWLDMNVQIVRKPKNGKDNKKKF